MRIVAIFVTLGFLIRVLFLILRPSGIWSHDRCYLSQYLPTKDFSLHCQAPSLVIIVGKISLYPAELYETGIDLITSSVPRIPTQCLDPRIKSLNYLNNILAKIEARQAGVPEALMLNLGGRVAECTADNIFIVKNGQLETPDLMQGALGGVTRASVLQLAQEAGIPTSETILGLHDIYNADECFLTGTGAEVMPVVTVDGRRISDGKPGKMTLDLLARFRKLRVRDGEMVDYDAAVALER
jgi:branched-chain amino acid aminotransferase